MKIYFDNVNTDSSSGPNGFAKKLINSIGDSHKIYTSISQLVENSEIPDIQLAFITCTNKLAPVVQRLDGIYFNSEQDFELLNREIEKTYNTSESVIFQSEFNKCLTESFFGIKDSSTIIRNGTDLNLISSIKPIENEKLETFENVWLCASSWRPHKRLSENIRYFLEKSSKNDCLIVAGENPDSVVPNSRIFYAGHVNWHTLLSLMKKSKYFLHLAWLDHCPNVVVDARAAGCHIVCSSAGGTKEICGTNSTIVVEDDWDFSPIKLYHPPKMDFSNFISGNFESEIDIINTKDLYIDFLERVLR